MLDGFVRYLLPSRATFMLDVVAVAMFLIIPALSYSLYLVKVHRDFKTHKAIQLGLGVVLLAAVTLFEIDIRLHGWRHLATASPYYDAGLFPVLYVHLFFAVSTTVLWGFTIVDALRKFPSPIQPSPYGEFHKRIAWLAAIGMYCTSVTGWTFYYMAFMAS